MEFQHKSVLLQECIDALNIRPDGIYLDGTLGGAGHSSQIARRLTEGGRLIGVDRDRTALAAAKERLAPDNSDNTDGNDIPAEGLTFPNPVEAPETITTVGPDGSPAAWYTELELTPEELAQVRSMNLTACFELINASEWDNANLIGFQDACEAMNIKIVGQGCCDLDPIQQKTNMESFAALNPDIVTCQPQDLDVCAPTFDPLWQAGVKLTFMSNVPTGYTAGKEYVGAITDSIVDMGIDSAEMMADAIGGEGEILAITVADVNYVCNTRDDAFLKTIAEQYPNITVAEVGGFSSPNAQRRRWWSCTTIPAANSTTVTG